MTSIQQLRQQFQAHKRAVLFAVIVVALLIGGTWLWHRGSATAAIDYLLL